MQVIPDFAVKPQEYFLKGEENDFPQMEKCPHCHDLTEILTKHLGTIHIHVSDL